jgi:hypothetical protein
MTLLLSKPAAAAGFARVQGAIGPIGTGTAVATAAATLGAPVGSGNFVVGCVMQWTNPNAPTSVTDDKGNSYTVMPTVVSSSATFSWFYKEGIANGPTTITANFNGTSAYGEVALEEWSGVVTSAALDTHANNGAQINPGVGTDAVTVTITTATDNCLILGIGAAGGNPTAPNAGTGFTMGTQDTVTTDWAQCVEHRTQGTHGAIAVTMTATVSSGTTTYFLAGAAFK